MELTNDFTVPVGFDRAWEVLTDVELIAPCLPGAQLQEIEGEEYRGVVKVKVGPITAQYKGAARFKEKNYEERRLVLDAGGRDTRGQGSADAVITVTMTETGVGDDLSTHVEVLSDVTIKGKVAQFGRGMIADVSAKLLTQFVSCLEGKLEAPAEPAEPASSDESSADGPATAGSADEPTAEEPTVEETGAAEASATANGTAPAEPAVRKIDQPETAPVDLLDTAGAPIAKRVVPVAIVVILLILLGRRRHNKRS